MHRNEYFISYEINNVCMQTDVAHSDLNLVLIKIAM